MSKYFLGLLFSLLLSLSTTAQVLTNPSLAKSLDSIHVLDQSLRSGLDSISKKYAWGAPEMDAYWAQINTQDSLNQVFVFRILDSTGWPSTDEVGPNGSQALFLVIQHAPLIAQEKYFPMLQQAAQNGALKKSELAMLEDRINMRNDRHQVYGTQLAQDGKTKELVVWPLQAPETVDARRKAMGLPTMAEYLKRWNLKWNVAAYKKSLPPTLQKVARQPKINFFVPLRAYPKKERVAKEARCFTLLPTFAVP